MSAIEKTKTKFDENLTISASTASYTGSSVVLLTYFYRRTSNKWMRRSHTTDQRRPVEWHGTIASDRKRSASPRTWYPNWVHATRYLLRSRALCLFETRRNHGFDYRILTTLLFECILTVVQDRPVDDCYTKRCHNCYIMQTPIEFECRWHFIVSRYIFCKIQIEV